MPRAVRDRESVCEDTKLCSVGTHGRIRTCGHAKQTPSACRVTDSLASFCSLTCRRFSGLNPALLFRPKGLPATQITAALCGPVQRKSFFFLHYLWTLSSLGLNTLVKLCYYCTLSRRADLSLKHFFSIYIIRLLKGLFHAEVGLCQKDLLLRACKSHRI